MDHLSVSSIRAYHWLFALIFAFAAHSLLLMSYTPQNTVIDEANVQEAIIISLKSLKSLPPPQQIKLPEPVVPQQVEPIKPKKTPEVKKQVEKPKKKVVKKIPKPIVQQPKVAPPLQQTEIKPTPIKQAETPVNTTPVGISGEVLQDIKTKYLTQLSIWLAQHKRYPKLAKRRKQEGLVKVKFRINKKGQLISHQLIQPSPHASLNKEVEQMLQRASPMPAVPRALQNGKEEFDYTIPVNFNLNIVN